jgi:hypothetical protein
MNYSLGLGKSLIVFISGYLIVLVGASAYTIAAITTGNLLAAQPNALRVAIACCAIACVGGCLYCMRAIYLNKCVHKRWDSDWNIWYILRPLTSLICGGASFLFLKAGLLILESNTDKQASEIGFYALAFIAGLNVDKFVAKIEEVAQAVWGIEKSRSSSSSEKGEK